MTRGLWDRETVALILLAAMLPVALLWLSAEGLPGLLRLTFFLLVTAIWHLVWMLARAQPPSLAGAATALAVAILAPRELGPLPLLLGMSFGVVMGELAFGGWGRNVLNPATVALAFLGFGFPAAPWPDVAVQVGWAAIPAALIGAATGVMPLGVLGGAAGAFLAAHLLGVPLGEAMPAILAGTVLLVADPVSSATTGLGRWLHGLLFGALTALFWIGWQGVAPVQAVVSAGLLASLAAPLLDEIAIALWTAERRRRLG